MSMSPKTDHILTACFCVVWLAVVVWLVGPARLIAAIPSAESARTFLSQTSDFIDRLGPDHVVRLSCSGTARTNWGKKEEPRTLKVAVNSNKKILTVGKYPSVPIEMRDASDMIASPYVTSPKDDEVVYVTLDRVTGYFWADIHDADESLTFTGTCKHVDPLF
jgi:hypothetical protein